MKSTDSIPSLKVYILSGEEAVEINILSVNIEDPIEEPFYPWEEPKWVKFCNKHKFHPVKDYKSKFYRLYLDLCSEGLI